MKNSIDSLLKFINSSVTLSLEEESLISKYFEIKEYQKNEIILNAGEICNYLYFIDKGLLRTFHVNANGSEFTRLIVSENKFCTILLSFQERIASPATIQALEKALPGCIIVPNSGACLGSGWLLLIVPATFLFSVIFDRKLIKLLKKNHYHEEL